MHQALIKFQQEIEKDLIRIKTEWLNRTLFVLVKYSPIPGQSPYSTGEFINEIIITFDNHTERFNYTNNKDFFYQVKEAFANISITSHIPYAYAIEYTGWKNTLAYGPFRKTLKYSKNVLSDLCEHISVNEHMPGTQRRMKMFRPEMNKYPKISLNRDRQQRRRRRR
jgi:hypothetical protein